MGKQLIVMSGLERGRVLPLQDSDIIQLGCSQNLEVLARFRDPDMARVHCEVQVQGDRVVVHDADTPNGTYLNGKRIVQEELHPGDVLRIGKTELKYLAGETYHPKAAVQSLVDLSDTCDKPAARSDTSNDLPVIPTKVTPQPKTKFTADQFGLLVGRSFAHFKLGPMIGTGQWGRVFKAQDLHAENSVAVKVLWPEFGDDPQAMRQLAVAVKSVLYIQHPNLVIYLGAGKAGPFPWIAMEFVQGKSLIQIIRRAQTTGRLDWRQSIRIGAEVGRALQAAHERQLRHGNITPQAILLRDSDKSAKLGGLLQAQALENYKGQPPGRLNEQSDDTAYMSPERTWGMLDVDIRSDIYSLGAILYALLTGRPPFEAGSQGEVVQQIRNDRPIPPKKYQLSIPTFYDQAIMKMLAKEPLERPQNPVELLSLLDKVS
jgi:serine/threonine protein kinase